MGFLPFVPKASPTIFFFLGTFLQDYPLTQWLPLLVPMGLMAIIFAMLAHWAYYLFPWFSLAHLLYFYLLLCLWAY